MNIFELTKRFPTERAALEHLEKVRWHGKVICPFCGSDRVTPRPLELRYNCNNENRSFSILARTIFEGSHLDIRVWFQAINLMLNAKKGLSALQVKRDLGITYKTAWYCLMRIRCAMADHPVKLRGMVEVDTVEIGGKPRKDNYLKTINTGKGTKTIEKKMNIIAAVERGKHGKVMAEVIPNTTGEVLLEVLKKNIRSETAILVTDNANTYNMVDKEFNRLFVTHTKQFSEDGVSINKVEGFFSLLNRGLIGQYHKLSLKYLPFYLAEFTFRYNNNLNKKSLDKAIELAIEKNKCMLRYKCNAKTSVEICTV